jgi:hypothetical protein
MVDFDLPVVVVFLGHEIVYRFSFDLVVSHEQIRPGQCVVAHRTQGHEPLGALIHCPDKVSNRRDMMN